MFYTYINLASNPYIHGECSNVEGDLARDHTLPFRLNSLIRIENPNDRWCLARAVLIGLRYRECGENRDDCDFFLYTHRQQDHGLLARRLLSDAGISTAKEFYTIDDAAKIQELINVRLGAQQIRIVIFSSENQNKIIWKGWKDKPAKFNLCLYHAQNHFSFLTSPRALLKVFLLVIFLKFISHINIFIFPILDARFLH